MELFVVAIWMVSFLVVDVRFRVDLLRMNRERVFWNTSLRFFVEDDAP